MSEVEVITAEEQEEYVVEDQEQEQEEEEVNQDEFVTTDAEAPVIDTLEEILALKKKIGDLESEVENLRDEMRLLKRKFRTFDPMQSEYQEMLEQSILRVLDSANWRISRLILSDRTPFPNFSKGRRPPPGPRVPVRSTPNISFSVPRIEVVKVEKKPLITQRRSLKKETDDYDTDVSLPIGETDHIMGEDPDDPPYEFGADIKVPSARKRKAGPASKMRPTTPREMPDKVIKAGDVSVILEDSEEELGARIKKPRPSRPRPKTMPCEQCGKCFRDKHDLNRHMMSHSDVRPYTCSKCGGSFKQPQHMQRHVERCKYMY